jgi:N-acylglucosamine-6-phosphate 2-epimerase
MAMRSSRKQAILEQFRHGMIVSCQALEDEPLHGAHIMSAVARAAELGGAVGIRANSPPDIAAIKRTVRVPVIGLYKKTYADSDVLITPTMREVHEIVAAGADLVAIDATFQPRPNGERFEEIVAHIREAYPDVLIFADVSTCEEGLRAMELGCDLISTAIAGYTPYSRATEGPDLELIARLAAERRTPIVAEGRIWTPEEAVQCLKAGAYALVVGTAITRPREITRRFVAHIQARKEGADGRD